MSSAKKFNPWLTILLPLLAIVAVIAFLFRPSGYCDSAYDDYGFKVQVCPTGTPHQIVTLSVQDLKRAGDGKVTINVQALYTTQKSDEVRSAYLPDFNTEFFLVDENEKETPISVKDDQWFKSSTYHEAALSLPKVHDGDYLLRAKIKSKIGTAHVDLKLPLYAPARIHLLTDRPLYEPGNLVQFRALALRVTDLSPIDNRPGTWIVRDPSGEILLEEKAPAKEWGVASGDFPLARNADHGQWSVTWRSGDDEERTEFSVEPFVLPRFRVEGQSDKSFYQAGDSPTLQGAVVYSSGAPVSGASLTIQWRSSGAWPPPTEWIAGGLLPRTVTTNRDGSFALALPKVPADLRGQCTLTAMISAVDPAGDRVAATASILLSEDAIVVTAVTEFDDKLVESTNNRVFLRVTNPVGYPLGGAKINVKRAWSPGDEGIDAELDSDGVTRIQMDPGRPISVIVPAMPIRKSPRPPPGDSTLQRLQDMVSGQQAGLKDSIAAESWLASLRPCSRWVSAGTEDATVAFRVNAKGSLAALTPINTPLSQCVSSIIAKKQLPAGNDRLYSAQFRVHAADLPTLFATVSSSIKIPDSLKTLVDGAATNARECLPRDYEGALPWVLFWESSAEKKTLQYHWMKDTGAKKSMPSQVDRCILGRLSSLQLPYAPSQNSIGIVRYSLGQPNSNSGKRHTSPTIMQGYELRVHAIMGPEDMGSTTLRMQPGLVPNLRLRATPVLADPGTTIDLSFYRGPDYLGSVPQSIAMDHEGAKEIIKLEKKAKTAKYTLPADAKGWYEFSAEGARALVFVREQEPLAIHLTPTQKHYTPGEMAKIEISTTVAGVGSKAAVGLFGVDNSLSQITTLRGASDLDSLRPTIAMKSKAFGSLEAQALSMGRIRGAFAAEATVLRVQTIPNPEVMDIVFTDTAQTEFSPITILTDNFYIALAQLYKQTRSWEASAPKGELISPKKMSQLWKETLTSCKAQGHNIVDAYGRPLRLHYLPSDLLAFVDPANVISDATRLPEDVENWQQWVTEEQP